MAKKIKNTKKNQSGVGSIGFIPLFEITIQFVPKPQDEPKHNNISKGDPQTDENQENKV